MERKEITIQVLQDKKTQEFYWAILSKIGSPIAKSVKTYSKRETAAQAARNTSNQSGLDWHYHPDIAPAQTVRNTRNV